MKKLLFLSMFAIFSTIQLLGMGKAVRRILKPRTYRSTQKRQFTTKERPFSREKLKEEKEKITKQLRQYLSKETPPNEKKYIIEGFYKEPSAYEAPFNYLHDPTKKREFFDLLNKKIEYDILEKYPIEFANFQNLDLLTIIAEAKNDIVLENYLQSLKSFLNDLRRNNGPRSKIAHETREKVMKFERFIEERNNGYGFPSLLLAAAAGYWYRGDSKEQAALEQAALEKAEQEITQDTTQAEPKTDPKTQLTDEASQPSINYKNIGAVGAAGIGGLGLGYNFWKRYHKKQNPEIVEIDDESPAEISDQDQQQS